MSNFKTMAMPDVFDLMWRDFDSFFNNLYGDVSPSKQIITSADIYRDVNFPPMNFWVEHDSKDILLEFAVAGIPIEQIGINIEGDYLELSIDKSKEDSKNGFKLIRKGIKSGKAKQRIYIPASKYHTEKITAKMKDGILSIKVPSKEVIRPKKIQIEYDKTKKLE